MSRPTVLVVDETEARRKDVAHTLAGFGYEVIAAADADEGTRFATGLAPAVIVAAESLAGFGDGTVLAGLDGDAAACRLVLLGDADTRDELPAGVAARIATEGLTVAAVVRKLRTMLVAAELGLDTDVRLESIVGDLDQTPLLDLLPQLQRLVVSGRLVLRDGEIDLTDGEVVAASTGRVRGEKGFVRLARTAGGAFRILLGPAGAAQEIERDVLGLMALAMEDRPRFEEALGALPDLASRPRVEMGPAFFSTQFTPIQQDVMKAVQGGRTVWAALDAVAHPDGVVLEELARLASLGFVAFEEPEVRVRVVTDSTADLPGEVALRHGIHVVPLSVIFGERIFKDGVDITPATFYSMLEGKRDVQPRTNPPTPGEFLAGYRFLAGRSDIVSLHISSRMSETVANARAAAAEGLEEFQSQREDGDTVTLEVVDSSFVSLALGLTALFAARMARRGLSAPDIRARVEAMRERTHSLFVVDTLEYLARGGRIGKARALLGGILGIKPILGLVDGEVGAVDKVRGGRNVHARVVELFKQRVDAERPVVAGIVHAKAPVWADRLRTLIEESFTVSEVVASEMGPVVGTHVGPGTVAAVLFQPTEEERELIAPLPAAE